MAAAPARETAAQSEVDPEECTAESALCLNGDRFLVQTTWTTPDGETGKGHAVRLTDESGYFWFFDPGNLELVVKALNGCGTNGRYWLFGAGLTNVEVEITVTDRTDRTIRTYSNPQGTAFEPILDTDAFAGCVEVVPLLVTLSRYQFTPGGPDGPPIRLVAGVTYSVTFRSVDVVHGISSIPVLGIAHHDVVPGEDYVVTIAPTAAQRGTYTFACTRVCGVGHGGMFGRIEID